MAIDAFSNTQLRWLQYENPDFCKRTQVVVGGCQFHQPCLTSTYLDYQKEHEPPTALQAALSTAKVRRSDGGPTSSSRAAIPRWSDVASAIGARARRSDEAPLALKSRRWSVVRPGVVTGPLQTVGRARAQAGALLSSNKKGLVQPACLAAKSTAIFS